MLNWQKILSISFFLCLLLIMHGCALSRFSGGTPVVPEVLLNEISRKTDFDGTFMAQATMDIVTREGRYPLRASVVLRKPDLLRIESLSFIGLPDFFLVTDGVTLKAYFVTQGKFYKGRATRENLSRFLPLSFSMEDLVSILMGRIPGRMPPDKGERMKGVADGLLYRIDEPEIGGMVRALWVDPTEGNLVGVDAYSPPGAVSYRVRFAEFSEQEGKTLPRKLEISVGQGEICATIRYSEIRLVPDTEGLSPFDFPDPPGIEPIKLD